MYPKRRSVIWSKSKKDFIKLINESRSILDVFDKLGLRARGRNYSTFYNRINRENIDISCLKKAVREDRIKNLTYLRDKKRIPLNKILTEKSTYENAGLKARLLEGKFLKNECALCSCPPLWEELPLTLQLDHINGVSNDNRIENLRLLCPNCHSQTASFAGRGTRNKDKYVCKRCNEQRTKGTSKRGLCKKCAFILRRKVERPPLERLKQLIEARGYTGVGKMYGVSDSAVHWWIKTYIKDLK